MNNIKRLCLEQIKQSRNGFYLNDRSNNIILAVRKANSASFFIRRPHLGIYILPHCAGRRETNVFLCAAGFQRSTISLSELTSLYHRLKNISKVRTVLNCNYQASLILHLLILSVHYHRPNKCGMRSMTRPQDLA